MARNRVYAESNQIPMPVPGGTESGDPLVIGDLACVALTDRDENGEATVQCDGAFEFEVDGVGSGGNTAIEPGDVVYLQSDGSLDADSGGERFGVALKPVESGASTLIPVRIGY